MAGLSDQQGITLSGLSDVVGRRVEKLPHVFLREPYGIILNAHLNPVTACLKREDQEFCCTVSDLYVFVFLLTILFIHYNYPLRYYMYLLRSAPV